jgi:hypothetical protein
LFIYQYWHQHSSVALKPVVPGWAARAAHNPVQINHLSQALAVSASAEQGRINLAPVRAKLDQVPVNPVQERPNLPALQAAPAQIGKKNMPMRSTIIIAALALLLGCSGNHPAPAGAGNPDPGLAENVPTGAPRQAARNATASDPKNSPTNNARAGQTAPGP